MTKFRLIGVAAALSSVLAGPAIAAQHVVARTGHYAQSTYCATIQPGNPYSKEQDYGAWSGWRARGGWDSRGDDACFRNPSYSPSGFYPGREFRATRSEETASVRELEWASCSTSPRQFRKRLENSSLRESLVRCVGDNRQVEPNLLRSEQTQFVD